MEGVAALGVARILIAVVPFRRLAAWLDRQPLNSELRSPAELALRIRFAVETAARYVPWRAVCLPQALAAWLMFRRRGFASIFHFGVGKDDAGALIAHAWLEANGEVVVGRRGIAGVARLASFGEAFR